MELSISNVINISVSEQGAGLGKYNTSNLALFTPEQPATPFVSGYSIYLSPDQVGLDFGTDSRTYKMALNVFGQQPNILANNGYLVIIPMVVEIQTVTPSSAPVSGSFVLTYNSLASAAINWDDTASMIQAKLRGVSGLEQVLVTGSMATGLVIGFAGVYGDQPLLTVSADTLLNASSAPVTEVVAQVKAGEQISAAVTRTKGIVQYFGIICSSTFSQQDMLDLAAVVQVEDKLAFVVSRIATDVEVGGMIDLLRSGSLSNTRGLYYGSSADILALRFMAAYVGRALSTNFEGSNTTQTMHLKDLTGIQPDPTMSQTTLSKAKAAGADTYVSIQGVSKTFCSGANKFFDSVYNLLWLVGSLKIAGFNLLAQTSTKIVQTEDGVISLSGAYRKVCEQAVANQYAAPGAWTSPNFFGKQSDLIANIAQRGYYIYSTPVSQQSAASRDAREAPLVQIAIKEAGAIHSSSVIVNINK